MLVETLRSGDITIQPDRFVKSPRRDLPFACGGPEFMRDCVFLF